MVEFRAYMAGLNQSVVLLMPDEQTAMEYGNALAHSQNVELWQGDRRIAVFAARTSKAAGSGRRRFSQALARVGVLVAAARRKLQVRRKSSSLA